MTKTVYLSDTIYHMVSFISVDATRTFYLFMSRSGVKSTVCNIGSSHENVCNWSFVYVRMSVNKAFVSRMITITANHILRDIFRWE